LTTDTIARWLSACFSRDGGIVGATQIQSVLEHAEVPDNYALLAPCDPVWDALCVLDRQSKGRRCDAILITQDGSRTTELVGIITAFDLPRLYEETSLEPIGGRP
jgi:CBS domain-containing protein